MRNILLILLMVFSVTESYSQPNFGYYYTPLQGANTSARPIIAKCYDGSIVGTSVNSIFNNFTLFNIDTNGLMLWQKRVFFNGVNVNQPHSTIALTDSTFAIVLTTSNLQSFVIAKFGMAGNLLWSNNYLTTVSLNDVPAIAPAMNGGIIVADGNVLVNISASGSINSSFSIPGISIWDLAPKDVNSFSIWCSPSGTNKFPKVFDIDSTGIISNVMSYDLPVDTIGYTLIPRHIISETQTGSLYCTKALSGSPTHKIAVFYFDAQNQLIWSKKIEAPGDLTPRSIYVTKDNGCIINAAYNVTATKVAPVVLKFDSLGILNWVKRLGDTNIPNYDYKEIIDIVPDNGNGWYCTLGQNNIHIFHTDSVFDGFCTYQPIQPVVTNLIVNSQAFSPVVNTIAYTAVPVFITSSSLSIYRYDICTGLLVDSVTSIKDISSYKEQIHSFPNPASDRVTFEFPYNFNFLEMKIYNIVGEKLAENYFYNSDHIDFDVSNLPTGVYIAGFKMDGVWFSKKIVINHNK